MFVKARISFLALLFLIFAMPSKAALCKSLGNGDWTNAANWSCGSVPGCGDSVVIDATHIVTITSQQDYSGCGTALKISVKGTLDFENGNKLKLPCGSKVYVFPGGSIQAGGGGGNSNNIQICGATVWNAGMGDYNGPACLPPAPCPGNLPIKLTTFTATVTGQAVNLLWATGTEQNNHHFDIERSSDAVKFGKIAEVKTKAPNGNSQSLLNYDFQDNDPLDNTSYYRLKQVDVDLTYEYSKIITVSLLREKNIQFVIYPNPNYGEFTADISGIENNHNVVILLSDQNGRIVYKSNFFINEGSSQVRILPQERLPSGVYTCTMLLEEIPFKVKVVVN